MDMDDQTRAIDHYKRKLDRHLEDAAPDVILHCLGKLENLPVNIKILQETGIGKIVNNLKKRSNVDSAVIEKSRQVISKWKEIVANEEDEQAQERGSAQAQESDLESELSDPAADSESFSDEDHRAKSAAREAELRTRLTNEEVNKWLQNTKDADHNPDDDFGGHGHSSKPSTKVSKHGSSSKSHRDHKSDDVEASHEKSKKKKKHKEKEKDRDQERIKSQSKETDRKRKHSGSETASKSSRVNHSPQPSKSLKDSKSPDKKKSDEPSSPSKRKSTKSNGFAAALLAANDSSPKSKPKKPTRTDFAMVSEKDAERASSPQFSVSLPPSHQSKSYLRSKSPDFSVLTNGKTDDEALSALIAMSKTQRRTAVYSGNKRSVFGCVPKLSELCILNLQENVDKLMDCRQQPYSLLEPILQRAKPEILCTIEERNPYLTEFTANLWEKVCRRQFPKSTRQEFESWREMFERCTHERKKKLDFLTNRVQQSYKDEKASHRKTKLAYVDGVSRGRIIRPQDRLLASKSTSALLQSATKKVVSVVPNTQRDGPSSLSSSNGPAPVPVSSSAVKKPRVAPMMAKTLRMVRGLKPNFRR